MESLTKEIKVDGKSVMLTIEQTTTVGDFLEWLRQSSLYGGEKQWHTLTLDEKNLDLQDCFLNGDIYVAFAECLLMHYENIRLYSQDFLEKSQVLEVSVSEHVSSSLEPSENFESISSDLLTHLQSKVKQHGSPRDLAYDSLTDLYRYSPYLVHLCESAFEAKDRADFFDKFVKLVEGITVFTETIKHVKYILKIFHCPVVSILEADLLSILKDLQESYSDKEIRFMQELIGCHLKKNFQEWYEKGIPYLKRLREC